MATEEIVIRENKFLVLFVQVRIMGAIRQFWSFLVSAFNFIAQTIGNGLGFRAAAFTRIQMMHGTCTDQNDLQGFKGMET